MNAAPASVSTMALQRDPRRRRAFVMMLVIGTLAVITLVITTTSNRAIYVDRFQMDQRARQDARQLLRAAQAALALDPKVLRDPKVERLSLTMDGAPVTASLSSPPPLAGSFARPDTEQRRMQIAAPLTLGTGSGTRSALLARTYQVLLRPGSPPVFLLLEESVRFLTPAN